MSFEKALEMATINGAKLLGMADELGSLETGKLADLAIFDMRRPHVGSLQRPISTFVGAGKGTDAVCVIVNGEIVYRHGLFPKFSDRTELLRDVERLASEIIAKAGLSARIAPEWRGIGR